LYWDKALADRVKGRIDLLKNAATTQLRVAELEQELKEVREAAAAEKKKLEDDLAEEKHKTREADAQFNAVSIGMVKTFVLVSLL
jgi:septal ring factor EnvC (AmiA/AmiB activator)